MSESKGIRGDMTAGSPMRLILAFSIPLLLGNVLQQMYNMVDSIVVGNYVGTTALAAVGTGFPIIYMMVALFMGIGNGATVIISQYFGAGDLKKVSDTVDTIYTTGIVGVLPISVIGILLSGPLLRLINTPDNFFGLQSEQCYYAVAGGQQNAAVSAGHCLRTKCCIGSFICHSVSLGRCRRCGRNHPGPGNFLDCRHFFD